MKVVDFLEEESAQYEVTQHRPTFTAQQMAAEEHVPGMFVAKPVVVRADSTYYLCVLPACCKIDLDALRVQLGVARVELAEESELAKLFPDCALGAEPPFGALYGLETIMDASLQEDEYIVFQAGTHEQALKMDVSEYRRLAEPKVLSFSYHCR
ncbi:MAG: YbaK/EbsC family protein [Phycisphaerae bacterium]|nr:YbaK/EbsC family protein [Phycisphaerae bacterium]